MQRIRQRMVRGALGGVFLAALAAGTAVPALADSSTATATVAAGTLSETSATNPSSSLTLNGMDQTMTFNLPITATDATGSGSGWNLTVTSTQYTTGGATPHTLPSTASTVTGVSASCVSGATCTNPTNNVNYNLAVPAAATAPTAVKLFDAAANTGMGKFTVTPSVSVAVPANTYAGTYSSTITLAVVTGP